METRKYKLISIIISSLIALSFTLPANAAVSADATKTWDTEIRAICKTQKWVAKTSYVACLKYAQAKGFTKGIKLPKTPKKTKMPKATKAKLLKNIATKAKNGATPKVANSPSTSNPKPTDVKLVLPEQKSEPLNFDPVPAKNIPVDFFANVRLSAPLPTIFYKNEVYYVEGDLVGIQADEAFVFICGANQDCEESTNFLERVKNNHFRIPVFFTATGNFKIGLITGRTGTSAIENISVLPEPDAIPQGGQAATNLSVKYDKGETTFSWDGSGEITRLTIFQNAVRSDYLFRQQIKSFSPSSADFSAFKKGQAGWTVTQNNLESTVAQINLTTQEFRKVESAEIQVNSMQETFSTPGSFSFSGKSLKSISKNAAITLPNGQVKEFTIADDDVPANQIISVNQPLTENGTYIFEINNPQGSAVINVPIYVGAAIPLLPDFFALSETELDASPISNLTKTRQDLLALINKDRADFGLAPVALADDLNGVAQAHSQNMVALNFFGHNDPAGNSPDDRRKKAGVPTPIRENLGKATDLVSIEAGLMRSPVHRDAILDPEMKRVGLGVAKDSEGYFLVTQNFAYNPVTTADLQIIRSDLIGLAGNLADDQVLKDIATQWSELMVSEDFFGSSNPANGKSIQTLSQNAGLKTALSINIVKTNQKKSLSEELIKQDGLKQGTNKKIGLGLAISPIGEFYMTTIYSE